MDSRDYWRILLRRKWIVVTSVLASIGGAYALNTWTEPVYRATARIEIQKEPSRSPLTGQVVEPSSFLTDNVTLYTAAELITNRGLLAQAVETFRGSDLLPKEAEGPGYASPVEWLLEHVRVEPIRDTRLVGLHVEHHTREGAETIANLLAQNFVKYRAQQRSGGSSTTVNYLTMQFEQVRAKIASAEAKLAGTDRGGLYTLEEKQKQLAGTLGELRKNLIASTTSMAKAREVYKPRHPKLMVMTSEHEAILANLEETEHELAAVEGRIRQYSMLENELRNNRDLFAVLNTKLQEARLEDQMQGPLVQIVEPAVASPVPVRPRKALNYVICLAAGLLLGMGFAFLREYLRRTIRTPRDVDQHLGLPVLGLIPKVS